MSTGKKIYKLNDDALFRVCTFDDCTNKDLHWAEHRKKCFDVLGSVKLECVHEGDVHFHCVAHSEAELVVFDKGNGPRSIKLICPICSLKEDYQPPSSLQRLDAGRISALRQQAKSLLNSSLFKQAKLIRLDDYYTPELSEKGLMTKDSKYWLSYDVKETKDSRAILILYFGKRNDDSKVQFFIEPESTKLSHDHKDTSPLPIISRIEVEFKDGKIELKDKNENTK